MGSELTKDYDTQQSKKTRYKIGTNKEKRKPKTSRNFGVKLNEEQKEAKALILDNAISILTGKAGSGKTLLACQIALDLFYKREVERIIIIRSTVSKEDIGYLPGNLYEKMEPWLQPIIGNMYLLDKKETIDNLIKDEIISVVPIAFMRGRTFTDSFIIVDEVQNTTNAQLEMIVSRLGINSKMVLCGDQAQNDFKRQSDSGFNDLINMVDKVKNLIIFDLKQNHRHEIVEDILNEYIQLRGKREEDKLTS